MGLLATLGSKKKVQFIKNGTTVITFEASIKETHSRKSTATKFPIENGSQINDHIILEPFELSMTLIITDHPISSITNLITEGASQLTAKLLPPAGLIAFGLGLGGLSASSIIGKSNSPSVAAFNQIVKMQEMGEPFTVLTTLNRYENMSINSISVPRESQNGDCILVDIGLTQLVIVQAKTVQIKVLANPGLSDGLHDLGRQNSGELNGFQAGVAKATDLVGGSK